MNGTDHPQGLAPDARSEAGWGMRSGTALVCFGFVSVAIGIALACLFGGLHFWSAIAALILGVGVGLWSATTVASGSHHPLRAWDVVLFAAFALASGRAFFWLIYWRGGDWMILSPYNLGDLALHIGLIRYLASGVPLWPESLILSESPLVYPVGTDFFNSLLLRVGVPLVPGLIWVGLSGSALTAWALWRWGGGFAVAGFLFSGGLAWVSWIQGGFSGAGWEFRDLGQDLEWKNLFLAMFVTQRGFLLALPAGLLLLCDWRRRLKQEPPVMATGVGWVLYAAMPLFSVHAFLFLSLTLVGVFFAAPSATVRRWALRLGVLALVPASVCVFLVTGGFSATGNIRFHVGWMQQDEPWTFWIWNFGVIVPLWMIALGRGLIARDRIALGIGIPATLFFATCLVVAFAPWPWDNTKIMLWCWLAMLPLVWKYTFAPLPLAGRCGVGFCLFASGVISLIGGLDGRHGYRIASAAEMATVASMVNDLPPDSRFASAPDYAHPLILLGRPVAIGYPGHLWSHGLNYRAKESALDRLMRGEADWREAAVSLGVTHLVWGSREVQAYPDSKMPWLESGGTRTRDGVLVIPLNPQP